MLRRVLLRALPFLAALAPLGASAQRVEFVWSGALTPTSIRIVAGITPRADSVRLAITTGASFGDAFFTDYRTLDPASRTVHFTIDALEPDRPYRYAVEVDGQLDTLQAGRFRTPPDGPFSFMIAVGACADTGSDRPVFEVIRRQNPLFFLHLGDFHYENISAARPGPYREAYRRVLRSPAQAQLYRSTPVAYVWDDHDFGPNNSDSRSPGRAAARQAYQDMVPHYPLAAGAGDVPIAQAFTIGRLRFIVTDLRSARQPYRPSAPAASMMGAEQLAWFLDELRRAKEAGLVAVWISTVPWIDDEDEGGDTWGSYAEERRAIARFIAEHEIENLFVLSGDAHMVAIDDGTNSNYSGDPGPGFPVIHAAPLDRSGSLKGGPYSEGAFPNPTVLPPHEGQWVMMEVEDDGQSTVCVRWSGYRTHWSRPRTRPLVRWERCFDVPPPAPEPSPLERFFERVFGMGEG